MMDTLSRRELGHKTLGSLLTFSLLETLSQSGAFAKDVLPTAAEWLSDLDEVGRELKGKKMKQLDWQKQVETLMTKVNMPDLIKMIDLPKLAKIVKHNPIGETSLRPRFPRVEGLPTNLIFGHQIFALKKGRSVVPHGHNNMATAFLILEGDFRGRHYDRLEDEPKHMIVKPTIDRQFTVGGYSTVSDHKDNVHWFTSTGEAGFIFNIHVLNVDPESKKQTRRVYIDPNGEKLSGGRIRARRIGGAEANKLYG